MSNQSSVAFVRRDILPPAPPPPGQAGVLLWIRENLFSSVTNTLLTIFSIYLIWSVLASIMPWTFNGIWSAGSLTECRGIRDARGLESAACWAVINERWLQLLFGFYPTDDRLLSSLFYADQLSAAGGLEAVFGAGSNATARIEFVSAMKADLSNLTIFFFGYWRPLLAVLLLVVAIAPILYASLPRSMLLLVLGRIGLGPGDGGPWPGRRALCRPLCVGPLRAPRRRACRGNGLYPFLSQPIGCGRL